MPNETINNALSSYHLSSGTERLVQPAKKNFFEFIIEDIDGLLSAGVSESLAQSSDYLQDAQEIIRLAVHEVSVPHFTLSTLSIRKGNSVSKYAGVPTFSDGTLICTDYVGLEVKRVLEAWQNLAYNIVKDTGGRASAYKKNCTLIEYTSDHVPVRSWQLIGCWVRDLSEDSYNQESDDIQRITAAFEYDRAIPQYENV